MLFRPHRALTLARFVPHPRNQVARAAGIRFVSTLVAGSDALTIAGRPQTGKTHLLHALADFARQNETIRRVACMSAVQCAEQVMEGLHYRDLPQVLQRHAQAELLAIDDVDRLLPQPVVADALLQLLHLRRARKHRTLFTATMGRFPETDHPLVDFLNDQPAVRLM